jgi:hypothetical protein
VDARIFDPQKALEESPVMDDPEDMIRESKERDEYRLENREKEE